MKYYLHKLTEVEILHCNSSVTVKEMHIMTSLFEVLSNEEMKKEKEDLHFLQVMINFCLMKKPLEFLVKFT